MHNTITQQYTPLPSRQETKRPGIQGLYDHHESQPQPRDDFPAQSSFALIGLRSVALIVVLFVVTVSMLGSFLFLFSATPLHFQLPIMPFSWSSLILSSTSGGGGMLLWIVVTSIFKHLPKQQQTQERASLQTARHIPLGKTPPYPPEPTDWHDGIRNAPQRERHTEELETRHMRQRLQTLQRYDSDEHQRESDQKQRSSPRQKQHTTSTLENIYPMAKEKASIFYSLP